ncbi:XAC2610-related protein [Aureibaculum luteum]|uniref:XAC2610-related protein n=1 Tax=Aureibaculum luteum TaxID=1548456 RepID=UPI000E4D956E|nr:hypothetical protein [Aureibaculum luteum]
MNLKLYFILFYVSCFSQKENNLIENDKLKLNYIYHKDGEGINPTYFFDFIIYKNGNKIQVIKNLEAYPKAYFEDLNFDGITDIRISAGASRNPYNAYSYFFIYNPKTKKFEDRKEYKEISRPKYDSKKREITSIHYEKYGNKQVVKKFKIFKNSIRKIRMFSIYDGWEIGWMNKRIREEYDYTKNILIKYIEDRDGVLNQTKEIYKLKGESKTLIEKIITVEYLCALCPDGETKSYTEYWKMKNSKLKFIKKTEKLTKFNIDFKFIEHNEESIYK